MRFLLLVFFCMAVRAHAANCDELAAAAQDGDLGRMRQFIGAGVDKNCRHSATAETPLMWAAINGQAAAVSLLLESGADPNIRNAGGRTALDEVASREAAFAKLPQMAQVAARQRQVIALLEPRTAGPRKPATPVEVQPADPDIVARMRLEGARAAMSAGRCKEVMPTIGQVYAMAGVSPARRAQASEMACECGMQSKEYAFAKKMCEIVLSIPAASPEIRAEAVDKLKILRKFRPELFQ